MVDIETENIVLLHFFTLTILLRSYQQFLSNFLFLQIAVDMFLCCINEIALKKKVELVLNKLEIVNTIVDN